MIVTGWRIFRPKHADVAFTGEGARQFGGRWNGKGTAVVYTAGSLALAALEMLVHLENNQILDKYLTARIEFDSSLVTPVAPSELPDNWRSYPAPLYLAEIGDVWVASQQSAVLRVPSAGITADLNYLLNPSHPDFEKIEIGKPQPFNFDPRLLN